MTNQWWTDGSSDSSGEDRQAPSDEWWSTSVPPSVPPPVQVPLSPPPAPLGGDGSAPLVGPSGGVSGGRALVAVPVVLLALAGLLVVFFTMSGPVTEPTSNDAALVSAPSSTTEPVAATEPPPTDPPVTEPQPTDPPVTAAPVTTPPATAPPATAPPATAPRSSALLPTPSCNDLLALEDLLHNDYVSGSSQVSLVEASGLEAGSLASGGWVTVYGVELGSRSVVFAVEPSAPTGVAFMATVVARNGSITETAQFADELVATEAPAFSQHRASRAGITFEFTFNSRNRLVSLGCQVG